MADEVELDNSTSLSRSTSSASSGGPILPETPIVRRREKPITTPELKSNSNPTLSVPPKIQLAQRGGSAAGALGRAKSTDDVPHSPASTGSSDSARSQTSGGSSVRISSPLHHSLDDDHNDSPSSSFFPPLSFGFADGTQLRYSGTTPPPHTLKVAPKKPLSASEPKITDMGHIYSPHPNSIAMTTRDIPPKGWHISTEAGIVIGSAAAYHGSSVSKSNTKAMTQVVSTLNEARNVATQNMLKAASHQGCNAILALKFDTSSPVPEIFLVTAYGTGCVIVKDSPASSGSM